MPNHARLILCCLALILAACGQSQESASNAPADSRVPDNNVFSDQVHALEKAEDMQKTLDEAEAKQREVMEGQGQ